MKSSVFLPPVRDLDRLTRIADLGACNGEKNPQLIFAIPNWGARFAVFQIDFMICLIPALILLELWLLEATVMPESPEPMELLTPTLLVPFLTGIFALYAVMNILCETLLNGQTPGKNMTGLRVISLKGTPISPLHSLVRNLGRLIDILPGCGLVAAWAIHHSPHRQSVGDRLAGTMVVYDRPFRQQLADLGLPPGVYSTNPVGSLVESLLERRRTILPEHLNAAAEILAGHLEKNNPTEDFETRLLLRDGRFVDYLQQRVEQNRKRTSAPKNE